MTKSISETARDLTKSWLNGEPSQPSPSAPAFESRSQTTQLIELAHDLDVFHDRARQTFASFWAETAGGEPHRETWPLESNEIALLLGQRFYKKQRRAPARQAVAEVINHLQGKALFDGPTREVNIRVAGSNGMIFVDLCDAGWSIVKIDETGWSRCEAGAPVHFRRADGMLPLPFPKHGGAIRELRKYVNVNSANDFVLLSAWTATSFRPIGPYPIIGIYGEHGSGKTTIGKVLRRLVDPSSAPIVGSSRDEENLILSASNSWVVAFDNLSRIPDWLSNALCRLSTGDGYRVRRLYENFREAIFAAARPAILNAIEEVAMRGDLLERILHISAPSIQDSGSYIPEAEFWAAFEAEWPALLGVIFDGVSAGLANFNRIKSLKKRWPRMSDFAIWAQACEEGLGLPSGSFESAYHQNRGAANEIALEGSLLAGAIRDVAQSSALNGGPWSGTAGELEALIIKFCGEETVRRQGWPKGPVGIGRQINTIRPLLRAVGIEIHREPKDHKGKRAIQISKVELQEETAGTAVTNTGVNANTDEVSVFPDGSSLAYKLPSTALVDHDDGSTAVPAVDLLGPDIGCESEPEDPGDYPWVDEEIS